MKRIRVFDKAVAGLAIALLAAGQAYSITLTCLDGKTISGEISSVFDDTVTVLASDGQTIDVELTNLDSSSADSVNIWTEEHQHAVNVYTEFEEPPAPVRTNNPRNFLDRANKGASGMVAVDLVIDIDGSVIWAAIARSSNPALNDPSLAAVAEWRFKPAKVAGEPVRSRIRVPLRY